MVWQRVPRDVEGQTGSWQKSSQRRGPRAETLMSFRRTQAQARRLFTRKKRESWTKYASKLNTNTAIKHVWDRVRKISGKNVFPPKRYLKGKMVLPSLTPSLMPMNMQQHSQITPPLPTTVQNSRQSKNMMRSSESTSLLTIPKSTTNPSGWGISGVPSWRPNPVPLDLMGSTTIYWNIFLRTHWKSLKISWITSGPQNTSRTSGEQPLWSLSPNQIRIMLSQIVTDQSHWPAACARS